jgi:hypothetical protein
MRPALLLVSAALSGYGAAACYMFEDVPPSPPLQAKKELARVRIYVDPDVAIVDSAGAECPKLATWAKASIVRDVDTSLGRAGFSVVHDPRAPRDTVVHLSASFFYCGGLPIDFPLDVPTRRGEHVVGASYAVTTDNGVRVNTNRYGYELGGRIMDSHPEFGGGDEVAEALEAAPQIIALSQR